MAKLACTDNNCLNCKRPVCLLDIEDARMEIAKPKKEIAKTKDRKEYQHMQYLKRLENKKYENVCKFCGKKCQGQMIRIDAKNYCNINCVLCYLYEKNENKMKIIVV